MDRLYLAALPDIPQSSRLRQLAPRLWQAEGMVALWVAGSVATGDADAYSDLDVYIAVAAETADRWREPDLDLFFDGQCVARHISRFSDDLLVHHILLATGEVWDLHVQTAGGKLFPAERLILGCRDPQLRSDLEKRPTREPLELPVSADLAQELIEMYWYESHKHRKVLHRGLDLVAIIGLRLLHTWYLRLAYMLATGQDCFDLRRATIHSLTPVARALQREGCQPPGCSDSQSPLNRESPGGRQTTGRQSAQQIIGPPVRTRDEIVAALEILHAEMARIGRKLARRHDFQYPETLEAVVLRSWAEFKRAEGLHTSGETT
ncbi:MAG: nucleotidyltransferase domain-containing protein [Chloroflexi bacterium]|nr:nucleotidyltransferase domain-containing protein [Chloroflexota bacterium]